MIPANQMTNSGHSDHKSSRKYFYILTFHQRSQSQEKLDVLLTTVISLLLNPTVQLLSVGGFLSGSRGDRTFNLFYPY